MNKKKILGTLKIKKAAPEKKATQQYKPPNNNKIKLASPIEKRLVKRLLKSPCTSRLLKFCVTEPKIPFMIHQRKLS